MYVTFQDETFGFGDAKRQTDIFIEKRRCSIAPQFHSVGIRFKLQSANNHRICTDLFVFSNRSINQQIRFEKKPKNTVKISTAEVPIENGVERATDEK